MPVLDRQPVAPAAHPAASPHGATPLPPSLAGLPPRSVPETAPTPLQKHFVLLSVPVLILGAIAITALELGTPLGSPLVKLCVAIAAPLLIVTTADATVRIWRSAWAWMPVDRGKGLFRLAWVAASLIGLAALLAAACRHPARMRAGADDAAEAERFFDRGPDARSTDIDVGRRRAGVARLDPQLLHVAAGTRSSSARSRARTATGSPARRAATSPTSTRASSSRRSRSTPTARSCCSDAASSRARAGGPSRAASSRSTRP